MQTWLVTGGAGFIGANFVRMARAHGLARVVNLDKLTYAGHLENLRPVAYDKDHLFVRGDIGDAALVDKLLSEHQPDAVVNFAAESHVDRSILGPQPFIETNVVGTATLLDACVRHFSRLRPVQQKVFRFLHVSTDEVFGSLEPYDPPFTETHPYNPSSPYAASKAAADHLVRAYHRTYELPTLITNCSNNYGPYQHPEKLIPLMILNASRRKPLPVYGDGKQVRDWLYVEDHCDAIRMVLEKGRVGESYNIGASQERTNMEIVGIICRHMDQLFPSPMPHVRLVTHVIDRPGHDRRYAMNADKIRRGLGWQASVDLEAGLEKTLRWYLDNTAWVEAVSSTEHRAWLEKNYEARGAGL